MPLRRAPSSSAGQTVPWFAAAFLVALASVLVASWLNTTGAKVDEATLERGADAVAANIEEQIRILELASTGVQSIVGQSSARPDIDRFLKQIDVSVFRSLVGVVTYPVGEGGVLDGDQVDLGLTAADIEVPPIEASVAEIQQLDETGNAFISGPVESTDPGRYEYVIAIPVEDEDGAVLLAGVVFQPKELLDTAVAGSGEGHYAVDLVDNRYGDLVVASTGDAVGDMAVRRSPDGTAGYIDLVVRPGADFPFSQTAWVPGLVVAAGLIVALLLLWMGRMAQARAEDLVERLRLAQELNESKDRFLATVSHELRTPLTVVLGVAAEVGPHWDQLSPTDRSDLLAMMGEQAREASTIVEDLLVAARSDPSQLRLAIEATSLEPHLDYAFQCLPVESLSGLDWDGTDYTVEADSTRLRQILRNLLENAAKYGGANIKVSSQRYGMTVRVEICDDGPGVAEDDLERIFEPYERATSASQDAPTGVGIGLYVSRLLARLMGGDLDCIRRDGWTVFRLNLPTSSASPTDVLATVGEAE